MLASDIEKPVYTSDLAQPSGVSLGKSPSFSVFRMYSRTSPPPKGIMVPKWVVLSGLLNEAVVVTPCGDVNEG